MLQGRMLRGVAKPTFRKQNGPDRIIRSGPFFIRVIASYQPISATSAVWLSAGIFDVAGNLASRQLAAALSATSPKISPTLG